MGITRTLASRLQDYEDPNSLGSRFRARRLAPLLEMIRGVYEEKQAVRLLDVGGTAEYWNIVPRELLSRCNVRITLLNVPGEEFAAVDGPFERLDGDGCDLSGFADRAFDVCHSNSVIEHVGDWPRMVRFARETLRVARHVFVQMPSFWFPVDPHSMTPFFHWLPEPMRVRLVRWFRLGNWQKAATMDEAVRIVESARLLDRGMFAALFPDCQIRTERWLGLPKSFIAIR